MTESQAKKIGLKQAVKMVHPMDQQPHSANTMTDAEVALAISSYMMNIPMETVLRQFARYDPYEGMFMKINYPND